MSADVDSSIHPRHEHRGNAAVEDGADAFWFKFPRKWAAA